MSYPAARRQRKLPKPDRSAHTDPTTYVVVGHKAVYGCAPGEVLTEKLSVEMTRALVQAGHIAIAETSSKER